MIIETNYEVEHFQSGDWKDFKFNVPEFKTTADVVSRYGEEKTLGLLNQQISARIRSTVKNSLKLNGKTTDELKAELTAKYPDLVIYTKADADKWTPEAGGGETPGKLFKKAKLAFAAGDIEQGKEYLTRMEELMKEEQAAEAQA
jgi:hypothetical protein|tara:strand:+ start:127 stop:561 length:435 start_codon:yes stop_codon:yes gene_type:complete